MIAENPDALNRQYEAAVQFVTYESQLFWNIMGVFLVGETLLAGFLAQEAPPSFSWVRVLAALLGVIGSILWIGALLRSLGYSELRIHQAKALERQLQYSMFTLGERFAAGESVVIDGRSFQHTGLARRVTIKNSGVLLALLFAAFFVVVLVQACGLI